eukprot:scaffold1617_cov252-Pinguiococcus_pyrenoidosus.AAC.4
MGSPQRMHDTSAGQPPWTPSTRSTVRSHRRCRPNSGTTRSKTTGLQRCCFILLRLCKKEAGSPCASSRLNSVSLFVYCPPPRTLQVRPGHMALMVALTENCEEKDLTKQKIKRRLKNAMRLTLRSSIATAESGEPAIS